MSIINFAKNKFFDDDDYAYNAVANARRSFENVNPDTFPLNIDLIQTPDLYVIIADVPGVTKDRVNVQVKDNKILIEGKRKKKVISDDDTYLISGRRNGFFKKMIQMPMDADSQDVVAKLEDGMLILTVPRVKKVDGATYVSIAYICFLNKLSPLLKLLMVTSFSLTSPSSPSEQLAPPFAWP